MRQRAVAFEMASSETSSGAIEVFTINVPNPNEVIDVDDPNSLRKARRRKPQRFIPGSNTTHNGNKRKSNQEHKRTTRNRVQESIRTNSCLTKIKVENRLEGNVFCPKCKTCIAVSTKGCNVVTCIHHAPNYYYFCAHCKVECSEGYSTCSCPRRNNVEAREIALKQRNEHAAKNPISLVEDDESAADDDDGSKTTPAPTELWSRSSATASVALHDEAALDNKKRGVTASPQSSVPRISILPTPVVKLGEGEGSKAVSPPWIFNMAKFLDPKSFYIWTLVWKRGKLILPAPTDHTMDLLRRLAETLPASVAYANPKDMFTLTFEDNFDNDAIWEKKRRIVEPDKSSVCNSGVCRECNSYRGDCAAWRGQDNVLSGADMALVNRFVQKFVGQVSGSRYPWFFESRGYFILLAHAIEFVNFMNLKFSFPLERTIEIPSIASVIGERVHCTPTVTLREIISLLRRKGWLRWLQWRSDEDLSPEEQLAEAKEFLVRRVERARSVFYEMKRDLQQKGKYNLRFSDPYDDLGEDNMCDDAWEEWLVRYDMDCYDSNENIALYHDNLSKQLELLEDELQSLAPEDPSVTKPTFRLSRDAFRKSVELPPLFDEISVSALDFLQRIVEDIIFGKLVRSFNVHNNQSDSPFCCDVLVGDHGTTMFLFDADIGDNDDDGSVSEDSSFCPEIEERNSDDDDDDCV